MNGRGSRPVISGSRMAREYFAVYGLYLIVNISPFRLASVLLPALVLFLLPRTRRHWVTLNLGCLLIYSGVYLEKGMGLVIPGLTPDTLGEIYEYGPSRGEWQVAIGVFAIGFLLFTLMVKVATPIMLGEFRIDTRAAAGSAVRPAAAH
jgi:molybdopterin-containing oxidoreductase family membrane subunit